MSEVEVAAVWVELEKWLGDHKATAPLAALRTGATDDDIAALVEAFGAPVPDDLVASLKIHNGRASLDRYELLPVKAIVRRIEDPPTGKPAAPDRDHKVKPVGWSKGWLPFAEDSAGNCFCVDLDPGEHGARGQVIRREHNLCSAGPTPFASFGAWLEGFLKDAIAGNCEVDDEGFVTRK